MQRPEPLAVAGHGTGAQALASRTEERSIDMALIEVEKEGLDDLLRVGHLILARLDIAADELGTTTGFICSAYREDLREVLAGFAGFDEGLEYHGAFGRMIAPIGDLIEEPPGIPAVEGRSAGSADDAKSERLPRRTYSGDDVTHETIEGEETPDYVKADGVSASHADDAASLEDIYRAFGSTDDLVREIHALESIEPKHTAMTGHTAADRLEAAEAELESRTKDADDGRRAYEDANRMSCPACHKTMGGRISDEDHVCEACGWLAE